MFGTTGVQYSLPTTNKKTYLFANVRRHSHTAHAHPTQTPGTIRDIAFIQGDIGFSLISQYTRGTRAVSASTVRDPKLDLFEISFHDSQTSSCGTL